MEKPLPSAFLVIPHVERVLDDMADHLRREEVGELRGEGRDEGVEVSAFVVPDAARRGNGGAGMGKFIAL